MHLLSFAFVTDRIKLWQESPLCLESWLQCIETAQVRRQFMSCETMRGVTMNTMNQMSRRNFLRMSGLIGVSAMLAACSGSSDGSDAPAADADTFRIGGIGCGRSRGRHHLFVLDFFAH